MGLTYERRLVGMSISRTVPCGVPITLWYSAVDVGVSVTMTIEHPLWPVVGCSFAWCGRSHFLRQEESRDVEGSCGYISNSGQRVDEADSRRVVGLHCYCCRRVKEE